MDTSIYEVPKQSKRNGIVIFINTIVKVRKSISKHEMFTDALLVRLAAHVSNGLKSRIRPVVGRI